MKDFQNNKQKTLVCLCVWIELEIDREGLECFKEAGKSIEELIVWVYNEFILTANKELSFPGPGPSKAMCQKGLKQHSLY